MANEKIQSRSQSLSVERNGIERRQILYDALLLLRPVLYRAITTIITRGFKTVEVRSVQH